MKNFTLKCPAVALASVIPCISKEEVRYYLGGVCVDPEKRCLVTTDAHTLARFNLSEDDTLELEGNDKKVFKVPAELAKAVKNKKALNVEIANGVWLVMGEHGLIARGFMEENFIDGTFPEYERVIPQKENFVDSSAPFISCEVTKKILEVAKCFKGYGKMAYRLRSQKGENEPCLVQFNDAESLSLTLIVMPVRM